MRIMGMSRWARESLSYGLSRRLIRVDAVDYHHLWHQDYRPVATSGLPRDLLQRDRRSGRDYDEFMTTPEIDSLQSASLFNDARFAHPLLRDSVGGEPKLKSMTGMRRTEDSFLTIPSLLSARADKRLCPHPERSLSAPPAPLTRS